MFGDHDFDAPVLVVSVEMMDCGEAGGTWEGGGDVEELDGLGVGHIGLNTNRLSEIDVDV